LRYFAFLEATTAKQMTIDQPGQRWNCCALKVILNDVYNRLSWYYWVFLH